MRPSARALCALRHAQTMSSTSAAMATERERRSSTPLVLGRVVVEDALRGLVATVEQGVERRDATARRRSALSTANTLASCDDRLDASSPVNQVASERVGRHQSDDGGYAPAAISSAPRRHRTHPRERACYMNMSLRRSNALEAAPGAEHDGLQRQVDELRTARRSRARCAGRSPRSIAPPPTRWMPSRAGPARARAASRRAPASSRRGSPGSARRSPRGSPRGRARRSWACRS